MKHDDDKDDDVEEETAAPAKRFGRTDHVIVKNNDDERSSNHLTNNKRSKNKERPQHRQRNIINTSYCCGINSNKNSKKSTAARRRRRQRTLLWIIQFIIRSGVFVCIPFVFFWNANNVIRIRQQHNNIVVTTAGRVSNTAESTAPAEEVDDEKTKTIIKIEELSFVYANTTYRFRYHPSKMDEIIQRGWRPQQQHQNQNQQHRLPTIMFGVLSTSKNRQMRRDAIRSTWGKHIPLLFLVAEPFDNDNKNNENTNNNQPEEEQASSKSKSKSPSKELLLSEFQKYGDLLWLDVPEDYRNALTPKSFMFMQFVRKLIQSPSQSSNSHKRNIIPIDYIFKTDDDVWVNATEMSVELRQEQLPAYYGMNMSGRPLRDPSAKVGSKWVLTKQEYPRDDYPPYASGLGYALSTTTNVLLDPTNGCINDTMSSMNTMPWEDVATGLLSEACHVPLTSSYKYWTDLGNGTYNPYLPWEPLTSKLKDGNTIVKIIHKPRPHWYNALMVQGSLEHANIRYEEQRRQARQAQRQQRKDQKQQKQNKHHVMD